MEVTKAHPADTDTIMGLIDSARNIMRANGNTGQWPVGTPSRSTIEQDIHEGNGYLLNDNGRTVGYFAFKPSPEPTYARIYDGQWTDTSADYHVIHRVASLPDAHGVFSAMMDFCFAQTDNIRIDTHRDNTIMQHLLQKYGFSYCGIIHLANGDERLAYQKLQAH